jgi:hypothetical protein
MKKILPAILAASLVIIISGFTQQITCAPPYMVKGDNCCLDQNSNKVCDSDEAGGQPDDLIKNYRAYEVKMYISQNSPEPDSWGKLPPNPARHVDGYQIFNYPQDERYYDGGWFILYSNYVEETISCVLSEIYDTKLNSESTIRLTRKGFNGTVSGYTSRALFEKQSVPLQARFTIDCTGDSSNIKFQDAYAVSLRPP